MIHIQHISTPESPFFVSGTYGAEINNCVKPQKGEKVIIKRYINCFRETELLNFLQDSKVTNLIIVGMMTNMCVEGIARTASDFGFATTVVSDACATRDYEIQGKVVKAENVHNTALATLEFAYSKILTTEEYLK